MGTCLYTVVQSYLYWLLQVCTFDASLNLVRWGNDWNLRHVLEHRLKFERVNYDSLWFCFCIAEPFEHHVPWQVEVRLVHLLVLVPCASFSKNRCNIKIANVASQHRAFAGISQINPLYSRALTTRDRALGRWHSPHAPPLQHGTSAYERAAATAHSSTTNHATDCVHAQLRTAGHTDSLIESGCTHGRTHAQQGSATHPTASRASPRTPRPANASPRPRARSLGHRHATTTRHNIGGMPVGSRAARGRQPFEDGGVKMDRSPPPPRLM